MKPLIMILSALAMFSGAYVFVPTDPTPHATRHLALMEPKMLADEDEQEPRIDGSQTKIAIYIENVMRSWAPARIPMVDLTSLASDIASVTVSDEHAWKDDETGARTAVLLAALAYFEGARFAEYVDDGRCQEWGYAAWKKRSVPEEARKFMPFGMCDGGHAQSLWQVHSGEAQGEKFDMESLKNRVFAAHIALGIARRSLRATGTLRYYTGEWPGASPKADDRLNFAKRQYAAHPMRQLPME
jgi:hypothetical protein